MWASVCECVLFLSGNKNKKRNYSAISCYVMYSIFASCCQMRFLHVVCMILSQSLKPIGSQCLPNKAVFISEGIRELELQIITAVNLSDSLPYKLMYFFVSIYFDLFCHCVFCHAVTWKP